jgi:hypothetical protein
LQTAILGFIIVYMKIDLFNNQKNNKIHKWEGERRHRMPKKFFLSGCTG